MSHPELPATELFLQLEEAGRSMSSTHESVDAERRKHDAERRRITAQLEALDEAYEVQAEGLQKAYREQGEQIRQLALTHRELLFPGAVREKKFGDMTLTIRTTYHVRADSENVRSDGQLVLRANNPRALTPRGLEQLMRQVQGSPGIEERKQLIINFDDQSRLPLTLPFSD